jgi:hypothetical protein
MTGVRKAAGYAEAARNATEARDVATTVVDVVSSENLDDATLANGGRVPAEEASVDYDEAFACVEPLPLSPFVANDDAAHDVANASDAHDVVTHVVGDVSSEVVDNATLANGGRVPAEGALVDYDEAFASLKSLPLSPSIANDGAASIGNFVSTEADHNDVAPEVNADDSFATFMEDVVEPALCAANFDTGMEETQAVVSEVESNTTLSFKEDYAKSIQPVMAKVDFLFARAMWSGIPIATHPLASDEDHEKLLSILRKISPSIGDKLQIDSSNIKKHPEIQKVLDNHSRGSAYFQQFFKRPLVADCDCVACREGIFSPIIMPVEAPTLGNFSRGLRSMIAIVWLVGKVCSLLL